MIKIHSKTEPSNTPTFFKWHRLTSPAFLEFYRFNTSNIFSWIVNNIDNLCLMNTQMLSIRSTTSRVSSQFAHTIWFNFILAFLYFICVSKKNSFWILRILKPVSWTTKIFVKIVLKKLFFWIWNKKIAFKTLM